MKKILVLRKEYIFFYVLLFVISTLSISSFSQTGLIWEDNFDGSAVDTTKWTVQNEEDPDPYGNPSDSWYRPENVVVSGGTLKIYNKEEIYNGKHWTGGGIKGKTYPQYKYLEARVRHSAANTYIWATWWTVGWNGSSSVWPPEIDINEFQGGNDTPLQAYHWDYAGSGHQNEGNDTNMDETQWHTYGAYWSATEACIFYVNGVISSAPIGPAEANLMRGQLKITSSPSLLNRYTGCPLGTMEVDYVRIYDNPPTQTGTINLALNKPVITSSAKNTGGAAKRTVDESNKTRWESNWCDPQWIKVDLEAVCSVNQVKLMWQAAAGRNYKIQIADTINGPWTDCYTVSNNSTYNSYLTYNFTAKTGRYIQLNCTARASVYGSYYGYSLYDFQVFGTVTDPTPPAPPTRINIAQGKTATASTTEGANSASRAFDGNNTTRWASNWTNTEWIYVDLGATYSVDAVNVLWESAAADDYKIQIASSTSGPWTDCITITNSGYGLKMHEFTARSGRYVRMYATSRTTEWGYSIYEMQVFSPNEVITPSPSPSPSPSASPSPTPSPTPTETPVPVELLEFSAQ